MIRLATTISLLLATILISCGGEDIVVEDVRSRSIPKLSLTVVTTEPYTEALTEIATSFTTDYPDYRVDLIENQLASSVDLDVLNESDVVICNSRETFNRLVAAGKDPGVAISVADSVTLGRDRLVVVVPRDSGLAPASLQDLASLRYRSIAVPPPTSTSYSLILQALKSAGAEDLQRKFEHAATMQGVVRLIEEGKAESGIIYGSMRGHYPEVKGAFTIPFTLHGAINCQAMVRPGSPRSEAARLFVRHLRMQPTREILTRHGFLTP